MLHNMSLAQRRAMMQRGLIAVNQGRWVDYARARNESAFYEDSDYDYGVGSYQRYYAQQQARQAEFQRQRFLNAQKFQNNYMLQQQKAQDIQLEEEREVARNKQEMERKLSVVSSELDALQNNPEVDQNSWEYKARRQQLLDDRYELETELERNTPQVHEEDSGFKDSQGNPIMSRFILDKDGEPIYHVQGKDVAANQLERDKFEQAKIDAAREANHKEKVLEETKFNNRTARFKERNAQAVNERKASGADVDPLAAAKKKFGTKSFDDLLTNRKLEIAATLEERHGRRAWDEFGEAQQGQMINDELELRDDSPSTGVLLPGTPTNRETQEEAVKRYNRTKPTPEDQLDDQAMYDEPMYEDEMEPEFSDEQFAGTEPAGLYDPTGQPLPMDGGMYNGYA